MKQCAPFLKLDSEYIKGYNKCMQDFKQLRQNNKRFKKLIQLFEVLYVVAGSG